MLHSLVHNAGPHRRLVRPLFLSSQPHFVSPNCHIVLKPSFIFARPLSTPQSSPDTNTPSKPLVPPPPNTQLQRKHKVGLGPGPIKPPRPSTHSARHVPSIQNLPSQKLSPTTTSSPLNEVKESAKRDIEEAEAHGILTPPPPDANWFKRTMHKGIQLAKFYFRGVKLIVVRRREISEIRARIKSGGSPLTRAEFRFIQTQKDDVNKVIPFIIIALLLEEVIPLIAIYAPAFLPSTCILPSQQKRIQDKKTQKALGFAYNYSSIFTELKKKENPPDHLSLDAIRSGDAPTAICGLLGLSTIGNDALRIYRIRRHLKFIAEDDRLLLRDGLQLSEKELTEALEERGLVDRQLSQKSKEAKLRWWLSSIHSSNSDNALARRLSLMIQHSANLRPLYT